MIIIETKTQQKLLEGFRFNQDKGISSLLNQIYAPLAGETMQSVTAVTVGAWLRENGYIVNEFNEGLGANNAVPTEKGKAIGLYTKTSDFIGKKYLKIMYSEKAQKFIIEHFMEIAEFKKQ